MSNPALYNYSNGLGQVGADNFNTFMQTCTNMAQLRAFAGNNTAIQVYVRGTTTPNDGGQGTFYWNASITGTDDNGVTTIVPSGVTVGCWIRLNLDVSNTVIIATRGITGATLANRFGHILNVVDDYGAVGNGVADDTAALQGAINAISTLGGTLFIPDNLNFAISSPLTISGSSNIRIRGNGTGSAITALSSFSGNEMILISNSNSVQLQNLYLNGNNAAGLSTSTSNGLIVVSGAGTYSIDSNYIVNATGNGVRTTSTATVNVTNNHILTTGYYALFLRSTGGGNVINNYIDTAAANGIYVDTSGDIGSKKLLITNNIVKNITDNNSPGTGATGNGIQIFNSTDIVIDSNLIYNCEYSAIRSNGCKNVAISGNYCENSGETAIYAEFNNEYHTIVGNTVNGYALNHNGTTGSANGITCTNLSVYNGRAANITGNIVYNGYGDQNAGIVAEGDCVLSGNMIDGCQYGVIVGTNSFMRNVVVSHNLIEDKYAPTWATSTTYQKGARVTANGNVYFTGGGGTSSNSGGGPSGTGSSISDGTITWSYQKASFPLKVGIWPSRNTSASGYCIVENNHIYDETEHKIYGQVYTPPYTSTAFTTGSKIYIANNYPGIPNADLPPTAGGGSNVYETDTGAYRVYDDVHSAWMNLSQISGSATFDPGTVADGDGVTSSGITVTGAAFGDMVAVGAPYDLLGVTVTGYVSASNTVKIRVQNESGSSFAPGSGTWKVKVLKA
jgi:uncharacterized secreted repeat protein (TIGR03808 family)